MHRLHFSKTGMFLLNEFQVYKTLIIQIKFIEKKEKMLKTESRIFIFSCVYCNYEATSRMTFALFSAFQWAYLVYCLKPILKVRKQTVPSCSKLTTSLVKDSLKFTLSDTQICWKFLLKKCECKSYSHFFQQKISEYCILNSLKQLTKWPLTSSLS